VMDWGKKKKRNSTRNWKYSVKKDFLMSKKKRMEMRKMLEQKKKGNEREKEEKEELC